MREREGEKNHGDPCESGQGSAGEPEGLSSGLGGGRGVHGPQRAPGGSGEGPGLALAQKSQEEGGKTQCP